MGLLAAWVAGVLFGVGLAVSGMTNPLKVQNFLDVSGAWDPSLALVMGGAMLTTLVGYRQVRRLGSPWWAGVFHWPELSAIDRPLLLGAALFGVGWGLAGYCPGPALGSIALGNVEVWWFAPAMLVGGLLQRWVARRRFSR